MIFNILIDPLKVNITNNILYCHILNVISGTITYGVLKVEDGNDVSQIVTTGTTVQPVLTTNLNGQLYVIGNPNDVLVTQSGTRAIAPRSSILEGTSTVPTSIKKVVVIASNICNALFTIVNCY